VPAGPQSAFEIKHEEGAINEVLTFV
jgi:hypothetical protein